MKEIKDMIKPSMIARFARLAPKIYNAICDECRTKSLNAGSGFIDYCDGCKENPKVIALTDKLRGMIK